jgi:hypothetical protein
MYQYLVDAGFVCKSVRPHDRFVWLHDHARICKRIHKRCLSTWLDQDGQTEAPAE